MYKYGKIMRAEREMVQVDGRHTQWTNGTWHLFMTNLYDAIPGKITMEKENKLFTISVWYKGQKSNDIEVENSCTKCELLYKELVIKVLKEEEVSGIQLYPAGWPRKLQLTVKDEGLKEKILMEGLDIFGNILSGRIKQCFDKGDIVRFPGGIYGKNDM